MIRILAAVACLVAGCAAAGEPAYDLEFFAGDRVDAFPGLVSRGGESACSGEVVTARITSVPVDDHALSPDVIHEIVDGAVARKWRVPLESEPSGIRGDSLVVVYRRSAAPQTFLITTAGDLQLHRSLPAPPESAYSQCPDVGLPESGYRWCMDLTDMVSGTTRKIAFEGPCT